jgi:hypothetical protein
MEVLHKLAQTSGNEYNQILNEGLTYQQFYVLKYYYQASDRR